MYVIVQNFLVAQGLKYYTFLTLSVPTGGPFGPPQFLGTRFLHNNKGNFSHQSIQNVNSVFIFHLVCFLCHLELNQLKNDSFLKAVKKASNTLVLKGLD